MLQISEENLKSLLSLAWLAGICDGEGHVAIKRKVKAKSPGYVGHEIVVSVRMTDRETIATVAKHFGAKIYECKVSGNRKRKYGVELSCNRAAELLRKIRPYMVTKLKQANVALALQDTKGLSQRLTDEMKNRRNELFLMMKKLNERGINNGTNDVG